MIYADFESVLMPKDNGKQNPEESYTKKYQKHVACSYGYKLGCVDGKFSKPCKIYLGKDAVYDCIGSIIKESKYCSEVIEKHFNKEIVMTKEDNEDFKNSTKYWICDDDFVDNDVKVRDHCHITENYKDSVNRDCNINFKLNYKIPFEFHNLKNYDYHLIMQEPDKFNLEINVIPNRLSFTIRALPLIIT